MFLPGYEVSEELHRGRRQSIWRGTRQADARTVIIKAPADEFPDPSQLAALRREYQLLARVEIEGVVRALELVTWRDRVALVLEDLGDRSLQRIISTDPLDLAEALRIAIEVTRILLQLHRDGIVHKDLTPANILVDSATGRVTLTGFGMEGTLAYMSPEQTGRMNREVDYRTDFCSLGVTLFEALTGTVPFESTDRLEVIHGHIARAPADPGTLRTGLPPNLCELVLRLLRKAPEERYQSARGILHDLQRMAAALEATGKVPTFELATADVPARFVVAPHLYGREEELRALRQRFQLVTEGRNQLVLVAGHSGVGKTSLIRELHVSMPGGAEHLVSGKFDQLARDVPYHALAQAFRTLIAQTLSAPEKTVQGVIDQLREALGANAQVLIDVIPELEQLLGPQPPAQSLGSTETQSRFNRLFQRFVRIFASREQPLILFLDDLQWADAATLSLLPLLLDSDAIPGLLLIGAYRDNEVSPTHSLSLTLAELAARDLPITRIALVPLSALEVQHLLADSLRSSVAEVAAAARLVHRKTEGNPFFVRHLLEGFARDGIIALDESAGAWRLDLDRAGQAPAADNVLALMAERIGRLEHDTQRILQLAACVGNRFDLETLAIVSELDAARLLQLLWPAADEGLLVADRASVLLSFRFLHDRVQQAAYALIPESERRHVHLTIGRLLRDRPGGTEQADRVFEIVNHLDHARDLITDSAELASLARLNLEAGRRAKTSAAYPSALGYFSLGAQICLSLPDDHHTLTFALLLERGEAEYLTGRMQDAEATFLPLIERARTPLERADVCELLITEYETLSRYDDAIAIGMDGLRRLGITLPSAPPEWEPALELELESIRQALGDCSIASLVELPKLEDPALARAMRLLQSTWTPSYVSGKSRLGDLLVARLVLLSLRHGNCEASAFGYLHHAITVGSYLQQYQRGAELGQLALAVNERFADLRLRAVVHHRYAALVAPWREPFGTCIAHAREAVRAAFESGNLPVAGYAEFQQAWYGMLLDHDLGAFVERHGPTSDLLEQLQIHTYAQMQRVMLQWAAALRGETANATSLDGAGFCSSEYEAGVGQSGIFRALHATVRLELLYLNGEYEEARRLALAEQEPVQAFVGSIWPALFDIRHALTIAALAGKAAPADRAASIAELRNLSARISRWAESAPANFRHFDLLVSAEMARIEERPGDAMALFEEALELTGRDSSPRHRALVNERYGEFWLARRQPKVAQVFLAEARYGYEQWGATAKVRQLDQRHGDKGWRQHALTVPGKDEVGASLDVAGIMKAAEVIAREINLDRLLDRLMAISLEIAGADHGTLVLDEGARDTGQDYPHALVQLVRRTGETLLVGNAILDERTAHDLYVMRMRPRSILCTPIVNQGRRVGVLYLENRLTGDAFTAERVRVLHLLSTQAAIAIENAKLYGTLGTTLEEVRRLKDRLQTENIYLQEQIENEHGFEEIVGRSGVLRRVLTAVEQVAPGDTTVLISGETGTGKELLARAIHRLSTRREHALVTVNCGAVAPGLVESELFGHEKGAFTGAVSRRLGRFEVADGGTLFLDEIGDLPLDLQVKLLRVLQEGEFERVGGGKPIRVNVRVIAATHRDLEVQVKEGKFRADLFYRLNVFPIRSPALRERSEDIPELVRYFVLKYATKLGKRIESVPREVLERLAAYTWPGNIRELANIIERSVILTRGPTLELESHLGEVAVASRHGVPLRDDQERRRISTALEQTGWRVSGPRGAAVLLGLKPTTLEARMKRLGLKRPG